jgi:DNA-binding MarR family transcriptional regulator
MSELTAQKVAQYIEGLVAENEKLRARLSLAGLGKHINAKKLTPSEVREIRHLHNTSSMTQADLAEAYDVNPATISRIVRRQYHRRVA